MNLTNFYTDDKFGLLIDLCSMPDRALHSSGNCLVNTTDGVQLDVVQDASSSGNVNSHVFIINESKMNIQGQQLESVQF